MVGVTNMLYGFELNDDTVEEFTQDYTKYQKMLIERINRLVQEQKYLLEVINGLEIRLDMLEREHESLKVYINSGKKMQKIENEFK